MKKAFLLLWFTLGKIQRYIMVITSVILVSLVIAQVLLRYVLKLPIMGFEELACLVGFWMYMTGAATCSRERSHIQADLLHVLIKDARFFAWAKTVTAIMTTLRTFILTHWAWNYVVWSFKSWERSPALMIPMIFAQTSLLVSSFLMSFYSFVMTVDYARSALGYPKLNQPYYSKNSQGFCNEISRNEEGF